MTTVNPIGSDIPIYEIERGRVARVARAGKALLQAGARQTLVPDPLRGRILRATGAHITPTTTVYPRAFISEDVTVGAESSIGVEAIIQGPCTIGDRTQIGPRVMIFTHTHTIAGHDRRVTEPARIEPVRIGNGSGIGAGAMIMAGVTIGDGVVIAAGSVVTGDCEDDGWYAGAPARRVRTLD